MVMKWYTEGDLGGGGGLATAKKINEHRNTQSHKKPQHRK